MIRTYCELLDFPHEATESLCTTYSRLMTHPQAAKRLAAIHKDFLHSEGRSFLERLQELADETAIDRRELDMVFLLYAAPTLRDEYRKKGIDDAIFVDTLRDLRYKLMECFNNYGVWGTFVTFWYPGFYRCERFALGRLQFERRAFRQADYHGLLKEGDTVLNCHIPSSGPLTPASVIDSFKRSYAFYSDVKKGKLLPVVCNSWLLYPPLKDVFGTGNLKAFHEMFDVLSQKADPANGDYWRVFDRPFSADRLSDAPEDTGLRRRLKAFLQDGNAMGGGYGVLLFDGERIIKSF